MVSGGTLLLPGYPETAFEQLSESGAEFRGAGKFEEEILAFCRAWLGGDAWFQVRSSGSTGEAKTVTLSREAMRFSAGVTVKFFGLKAGMEVFCPLSVHSIAGKMMLVRAMEASLRCRMVPAQADLRGRIEALEGVQDLAVLVPLQASRLAGPEGAVERFGFSRRILLGGAGLDSALEGMLQGVETEIWHSYGMTESCSHVAMRRVNGDGASDSYRLLEGVEAALDGRGCLRIRGGMTDRRWIQTNDIAELRGGVIDLQGRYDDVINSGGHKIHPEKVEAALESILRDCGLDPGRCCVAAEADAEYGEVAVLVTEEELTGKDFEAIRRALRASGQVGDWDLPKAALRVETILRTESGKIMRGRQLGGRIRSRVYPEV